MITYKEESDLEKFYMCYYLLLLLIWFIMEFNSILICSECLLQCVIKDVFEAMLLQKSGELQGLQVVSFLKLFYVLMPCAYTYSMHG